MEEIIRTYYCSGDQVRAIMQCDLLVFFTTQTTNHVTQREDDAKYELCVVRLRALRQTSSISVHHGDLLGALR